MKWPSRLTGRHGLVPWLNSVMESCRSCTPLDGVGYRVSRRTLNGFTLDIYGLNSVGGWNWKSPNRELDYGMATSAKTWCYLSASNPLVTDGAYDLVSGELIKARPGIWGAIQAVPAAVTNPAGRPAGLYFNVPTIPYPSGGPVSDVGAAGSMAGDLDQTQSGSKSVYWIYFGGYVGC